MSEGKKGESTLRIKTPVYSPDSFRLVLVSGPDTGKEITVPPSRDSVTIGTLSECMVSLTDPTVSRKHAEILLDQSRFLLRDLGSTNGTFVDNVRVQEAYLEPDSVIRVGRTEIRLQTTEGDPPTSGFEGLYGKSARIAQVFDMIERVAQSALTVLITGETGTGKELVARAIHRRSNRSAGPFTVVDCSSIPENLLESELFGHERGAFTGATTARKGAFEMGDGGTIFLDEIGELNISLQPKLLRVLERQEIKRLGSSRTQSVDVRLLAATNRDLKKDVTTGAFREDLYYRLSVLEITLPRLRDRREDIPLLAVHFLKQSVAGSNMQLTDAALELLSDYDWPGNIRQMRNVIERAVVQSPGNIIDVDTVRPLIPISTGGAAAAYSGHASLNEMEKKAIASALQATKGNKTAAAKQLGIAYSTLYEKIKKYGL